MTNIIYMDAAKLTDKAESHAYLKEILDLPEYYGENLDALYDCLTDLQPTEIMVENVYDAGNFYPVIKHVMQSVAKENSDFRILIVDDEDEFDDDEDEE